VDLAREPLALCVRADRERLAVADDVVELVDGRTRSAAAPAL
jgi:hypothetical protein